MLRHWYIWFSCQSDLVFRKDFIVLKAGVHKLFIVELVNFPSGFNSVETEVDDLLVGKLKTVPVDFNKVVKNTKFYTLKI